MSTKMLCLIYGNAMIWIYDIIIRKKEESKNTDFLSLKAWNNVLFGKKRTQNLFAWLVVMHICIIIHQISYGNSISNPKKDLAENLWSKPCL